MTTPPSIQRFRESEASRTWVDPRSSITSTLGGGATAVFMAAVLSATFGIDRLVGVFCTCVVFSAIQVALSPDPDYPTPVKRAVARLATLCAAVVCQLTAALGVNEGAVRAFSGPDEEPREMATAQVAMFEPMALAPIPMASLDTAEAPAAMHRLEALQAPMEVFALPIPEKASRDTLMSKLGEGLTSRL